MPPVSERQEIVWLPTKDIVKRFHPQNPRDHFAGEDGDISAIRHSLLTFGWLVTLTLQKDGYLLSGHGRALAAEELSQCGDEFFEFQWEKWLADDPARKNLAQEANERFNPGYWQKVPCMIVELSEHSQKAALVRLNNTAMDGKDSAQKMAALLAGMPKQFDDAMAWSSSSKKAFVSAFLQRREEQPPEPEEDQVDYEPGQRFERPDATDYSGHGDGSPNDAIAESGEYRVYQDGDEDEWGDEDGGDDYQVAGSDGSMYQVAEVNSDVADQKVEGVQYDTNLRVTRAVLLFEDEQLVRFKALAHPTAHILNSLGYKIDTVSRSIKLWRPDAVLAALEHLAKLYPDAVAEYEASKTQPKEEGGDE